MRRWPRHSPDLALAVFRAVAQLWVVRPKPYARFGVTNHTMKKHIALGLVASTLFLAGCCTTHKTAHWEYKTQTLYLAAGLDPTDLNKAAKDGWEFVSATAIPNDPNQGAVVVFKRRAQ